MIDYEIMISRFIDNELLEDEQKELFNFLAGNDEARETMKKFMGIKKEISGYYSGLEIPKTEIIALKPKKKPVFPGKKLFRYSYYFSIAASIILVIFLFLERSDRINANHNYLNMITKYENLQNSYENVLLKNLEIQKDYLQLQTSNNTQSENGIKKTVNKKSNIKQVENKIEGNAGTKPVYISFDRKHQNIPVVQISENDYIGYKIIGN
jgi:hypothetical protein